MSSIKGSTIHEKEESQLTRGWKLLLIICLSLIVFFPLFGSNLRFKLGSVLSAIFSILGNLLIIGGALLLLFGIFCFFIHNPGKAFKYFILGVILLSIAGYLLMPGSVGTALPVPQGYH